VGSTRSRIRRRTALVTAGPTSSRSSASARTSDLPLVRALDELGRKDNVAAIMKLGVSRRPKADPCSPCRSRARQQPTGARHAPLAGRLAVRLHRGRRAKERGRLLEEKWRHCVSITLDRLPNPSRKEGPPPAAPLFVCQEGDRAIRARCVLRRGTLLGVRRGCARIPQLIAEAANIELKLDSCRRANSRRWSSGSQYPPDVIAGAGSPRGNQPIRLMFAPPA
jgi:hypothetical protein